MRVSFALVGGLGLMLAACAPGQPSGSSGAGIPSAGTGTISPIQGQSDQPARPGMGVPSAGTGSISPVQGQDDQPAKPGMGTPSARTGSVVPVQGQDDAGPAKTNMTRP